MVKPEDFEVRVMPHFESLYRTSLYILEEESRAQNLAIETFIKAYRTRNECKLSPNCRVWLFGIMTDILINQYWSYPGLSNLPDSAEGIDGYVAYFRWMKRRPIGDSERFSFVGISEDHIKRVVWSLPDDFRLIVVLSLVENFSYREIAEITSLDQEAVKSKLYLGRRLMQSNLFDHVARTVDAGMAYCVSSRAVVERYHDLIGKTQNIGTNNTPVFRSFYSEDKAEM